MTGRTRVQALADRLGPRDLAVLRSLREFRLMTGNQLHRAHFHGALFLTQARKARAAMRRLTELRLVVRLQRRVGGIRSGSDGYIYGLSGLGHAVLDLGQALRRRHRRVPETKLAFESHVLAVSELAVRLGEHALTGRCVVEEFRAEPGSWRPFGGLGGGVRVLKPDAYVRLGIGEYETTAFIEQDMATESLPTISRKLGVYLDYWRSGIEQEAHDVFPRVWWLVPNRERLTALQHAVQQLPPHTHDLFTVALTDHAPNLLTQLPNSEGGAL